MIKELSDIRRLRRVGKIHLGVKAMSQKGNPYPKAVDYFVVKADESTPAIAAETFKKVYGENPKELEIMFPVDAVNIFWDCWYKSYVRTQSTGGKLICKGDGITANRLDMQTGELQEIHCLGPEECEYAKDKKTGLPTACRRVGTLQFLIPKVGILGVWQIDTGSFNGIVSLNSDIDMIRSVTGGRIAMIPLILKVVPKKCMVEGKQSIIHHLTVEWRGEFKQLIALGQQRLSQLAYQVEGPSPDEIPTDLMPEETVPLIGQDAAGAAPAEKPEPVQEAEAELMEPEQQEQVKLSQHEILMLAEKGMSHEAGLALKASMGTTAEFIKYLGTLPDRGVPAAKPAPAPAPAAKPAAPAPAAAKPATPPAPPVNLIPQLQAEFARLKWSQVKIDAMMRSYPDKAKLLTILKGAK